MKNTINSRYQQIGLDRRIHLDWLELTANLVLAGNHKSDVKIQLQDKLKDQLPSKGNVVRGIRSKTITVLMKVWINVPKGLEDLRDTGLDLLRTLPKDNHIAVHWGMIMAVYPFWSEVAAQTGRLLSLQGGAASVHVQRRIRERYGERETVSTATHRLIRSFIDWGVLVKTSGKRIYSRGLSLALDEPKLISWLIEASLHARPEGKATVGNLLNNRSLFPFQLSAFSENHLIDLSPRLEVHRNSSGDDLIILRTTNESDLPKV